MGDAQRPPGGPLPARAGSAAWVCLVYHDVTDTAAWTAGGKLHFSVSAAGFDRQLDLIERLGLRGCSLAAALEDPARAVAITFDDGDLGQAVRAFPALARRKMSATFFITTSWVETPGYASWSQLREMAAAGMSIQSHTHTHPFLSELDATGLRDELQRSRELLDEKLGQRTTMLALPGGDAPRPELLEVLQAAGYDVVATSRWGVNRSVGTAPRFVNRCTVRADPDETLFKSMVTGDPWLRLRKQSRERILAAIRRSLGPTRYARWRRKLL